jgi:hypothetical protein
MKTERFKKFSKVGGPKVSHVTPAGRSRDQGNHTITQKEEAYQLFYYSELSCAVKCRRALTPTSRKVAVINETFVRKFFPREDPMGKHFGLEDARHSADFEIVGIVEDTRYQDARQPANEMYPSWWAFGGRYDRRRRSDLPVARRPF